MERKKAHDIVIKELLDNKQEFKDFIQNIKPSDFEKMMKGKHEESDQ